MKTFLFRLGVIPVVLLVVGGLLTACSEKSADSKTPKQPPAAPVTVATVEQRAMPVQLRAVGNVEAYATVSVRSLVDGQLVQVHFRRGQNVKKDDLLFTIDPRPFVEALRQAEADLARDKAHLENARVDEQRYRELVQKDYASREIYDKMRATYAMRLATVQAGEAAVSNAKLKLEYTVVRSPLNGRTGDLRKDLGNVIKAKDDELVVINQVQPIYVSFSVPEQHLPEIQPRKLSGLTVEVSLPNADAPLARGQLTFISNAVDVATGSIQLKATFANEDDVLWPGQFVSVMLTLDALPQAIVAPSQAVQTGQQGEFVFVVKPDHTVEMRPVTVNGTQHGLAVIESGLKPGEVVVTDGQLRLVPGAKVEIKSQGVAGAAPGDPASAR